jgi:hypothetical protein
MSVVPAQRVKTDFYLLPVPSEYPFVYVSQIHVRCLVCKTQFPAMNFTQKSGKRACPRCRARVPENMWQRIWNFVREDQWQ